ncbi:hypothetical protein GUJ93_ZPchr0006g42082 [Zizania palustris]|uniref:Uncharacterized protein n=1 Tax=Zizania palustris TaxID=103762 RepID=A0A8J5SZ03_ZIZPA|nr:hypothetical protein GUJ93_ZPchr0006g42082 [Zizania palustris]
MPLDRPRQIQKKSQPSRTDPTSVDRPSDDACPDGRCAQYIPLDGHNAHAATDRTAHLCNDRDAAPLFRRHRSRAPPFFSGERHCGGLTGSLAVSSSTVGGFCSILHWCDSSPLIDNMVSFEMNDLKKIGLGLTGFGIFFSILGIIFFFDKGLIAMGNILFLSGLGLTIGLKSTMQFFTKPKNYKGTISFGVGFFLVLIGWPFFGMLLEAYGFVILFSGFWPTLVVFLQRIPILGWIFQQPFITSFLDRYRSKRVPV